MPTYLTRHADLPHPAPPVNAPAQSQDPHRHPSLFTFGFAGSAPARQRKRAFFALTYPQTSPFIFHFSLLASPSLLPFGRESELSLRSLTRRLHFSLIPPVPPLRYLLFTNNPYLCAHLPPRAIEDYPHPMSTTESNNKRIAKNTLYLYVRMFIMMAVGLFTSRVVLDALGAENYGINNVVGGVIVLFSFLNSALTSATQRFLNFYMGRGDDERVSTVFSMSMTLYILLSVVIIILGETVGLWFLNTYLNIPPERMWAAQWVYQFTIVQFVVNMLRIPYNASIIANERMSFYAYASLIDVVAKLAVCYLLYVTPADRLITYSLFYTIIPILISIVYKVYCNRCFNTTRYHPRTWEPKLFREILGYSGWQFLNGASNVASEQGLNIILNMFHGVTLNAAAGVANQVSGHVYSFVTNFQVAFQPQMVKTYAAEQTQEFHTLVYRASKFSYFLMLVIIIPLMFSLDKILSIWLVEVPVYTLEFCQLVLAYRAIDAIKEPYVYGINASGRIKTYKIFTSLGKFLNLPLAYLVLFMGMQPWNMWLVRIAINIADFLFVIVYVKHSLKISIKAGIKTVFLPALLVTLMSIPVPLLLRTFVPGFWPNLLSVILVSFGVTCSLVMYLGLSAAERGAITNTIAKKIPFIRKK